MSTQPRRHASTPDPQGKDGRANLLDDPGDLCRQLLETFRAIAILTLDGEARISGWNDGAERIYGYPDQEVLGLDHAVLFDEQARSAGDPERELRDAVDHGYIENDWWQLRRDGSRFRGRGVTRLLRGRDGAHIGYVKVVRDVTAASERGRLPLLESVVASANDAVVVTESHPLDAPGPRITYVNQAFTQMTGYTAEEAIGMDPRMLQGPDTDRKATARIRAALEREEPVRVELLNYRKDGEPFWVEISIVPVRDSAGRLTRWASVQWETTERRQAEETARRLAREEAAHAEAEAARKRTRALLDNIPDIAWMKDQDARYVMLNEAAVRAFGLASEEDALGRTDFDFLPPDLAERFRDDDRRVMELGRRVSADRAIPTPDGSVIWTETIRSPLRNGRDQVAGSVGIARDVTERRHAEEALRRANEKLQALVRASPLAVIALDAQGRVEMWSPAAERIFGWTEAEVIGSRPPTIPPDREGEFERQIASARGGAAATGTESERLAKDGTRVPVSISTAPLVGPGGELQGVVALIEDVTERRQGEQAKGRLTAILEATPDFVCTADPTGQVLYMNRAWREALDLAEDEVAGKSVLDLMPGWAATVILREAIPAALQTGSWSGETSVIGPQGREIPVLQVVIAHKGAGGEVEYLSTVIRDITDRKRSEETQRFLSDASRELSGSLEYGEILDRVMDLLLTGVADYCLIDLIDEEGEVRRVAARHRAPDKQHLVERLRAFPPAGERPPGTPQVFRTGETELVSRVTDAWMRAVSVNEEHLATLRELAPVSVLILPLRARGRVIGAVTCACADPEGACFDQRAVALEQDLVGRAALAIDNAQLYGQTQQLVRTRDEVLRVVAHDLRNPLNTIGMSAGFLLDTAPPRVIAHAGKHLEIVRRSVDRANALIQDLLDVARMEAGKLTVQRVPVDPRALVEESLELQQVQAEQAGLRLESRVPADLPLVAADPARLLQVFGNLIGNAIKFAADEGVILVGAENGDGHVCFSVSNHGRGIPAEEQAHLFDPFWQAQGEVSGAGLGLAISKGIVEALGGRIWVESQLSVGTTLYFTLPVAEGDDPGM